MKRRNRRIPQKLSFVIFFGMLVILPIITFALPKDDFSDVENRVLASFPKFSGKSVVDRSFMQGFEKYFSDHFAGRTEWISAKTDLEIVAGKKESNGVYIGENMLAEIIEKPNKDAIKKSVDAINTFSADNDVQTYVMLVPTASALYPERLPDNAPNIDQKSNIAEIYDSFSDEIITLDAYSALNAEHDEYIYYRTDHHWTTLGAYYVYSASAKKMGYNATPWDYFNIEHASDDFKGTLYSKALYDGVDADVIDIYYPAGDTQITSVEIQGKTLETYDSYYFREYLDVKDKYSVFGGTNQPITKITTNSQREQKLLIFKDSYANCYVPFLAQNYSEIMVLDMRYIDTAYSNLVDVSDYDQVLFLYNYSTFAQDESLKKLGL